MKPLILLVLAVSFKVFSQEGPDTSSFLFRNLDGLYFNTGFKKELNVYSLVNGFRYRINAGRLTFKIANDLSSQVVRSRAKSKRDDNNLSLQTSYLINEDISAGLLTNYRIFNDSRDLQINSASNTNIIAFSTVRSIKCASITPFAGYTSDYQAGILNEGYTYGADAFYNFSRFPETELNSRLFFRNDDISPRKNTLRDINLVLSNYFEPGIKNRLSGYYHEANRDFYIDADSAIQQVFSVSKNIQSRKEIIAGVSDELLLREILSRTDLVVGASLSGRRISRDFRYKFNAPGELRYYDSEVNEFRFDIYTQTRYYADDLLVDFIIRHSERDEKNSIKETSEYDPIVFEEKALTEARKNNISSRTYLSVTAKYFFSQYDIVDLSLFHSKLRYDTPSPTNYDDRDEMMSIGRIRYTKDVSAYLTAFLSFEASLNNLVCIFAERSANNNKNRIFRLTTGGFYGLSNFYSSNTFDISANYTVYDYEDINPNFKSFSLRQFTFIDSTRFSLSSSMMLRLETMVRYSEQADLYWNDYKITPTREIYESLIKFTAGAVFPESEFFIGVRQYSISGFRLSRSGRNQDSYYTGTGPYIEIRHRVAERINFSANGWTEFIDSNSSSNQNMTNLFVNIELNL